MPAAELTLEDDSPALVDVPSTWRQQQVPTASKAVATDPQQQYNAGTQSTDHSDAAVQATAGPHGAAAKAKIDAVALASFLDQAAPCMLSELTANVDFAAGRSAPRNTRTKSKEVPQCIFTLSAFSDGSSSSAAAKINKHRLQVTSLSWSKTGQTLAASFGRYDVEGWCSIPGAVATWNLARWGAQTGGGPDRLVSTESCLMCCAFHPAEPALLAGGTYNGEVVIWDFNRQQADEQVAKTDLISDVRHREPITAITWQLSGQELRKHGAASAAYRLFSLGADGRLLVWLWNNLGNPIYGYELQWLSPGNDMRLLLGGSCMAFCPAGSAHEDPSLLLVGTEGGRLLRCQVNGMHEASLQSFAAKLEASAAAAPGSSSKVELSSAVKDAQYEALAAAVNGLSACPHHRQLAVAAGSDGSLRVVDVLRSAPLLLLEPSSAGLCSTAWSPSRPLVFAAGAMDGNVYMYDLSARQRLVRPVVQLQISSSAGYVRQKGGAGIEGVQALAYNSVVPSTLAAAAGDQVKVWRLPEWLVDCRPGETKLLKRMLDTEDVLGLLRKQAIVA